MSSISPHPALIKVNGTNSIASLLFFHLSFVSHPFNINVPGASSTDDSSDSTVTLFPGH